MLRHSTFGIIIVPFIAVLIVELVQDFDFGKALKASIGSVVAFLASSVAQALIMFIMVIWFFIDVLLSHLYQSGFEFSNHLLRTSLRTYDTDA